MAKKYKSTKLTKPSGAVQQNTNSAFGKHANRLADARKKKIERMTDTQKRVMDSKKNNKMIKVSKKAKKFALLDEQGEQDDEVIKQMTLTHKGMSIKDMKRFDDVNLGESDMENDEEFGDFQQKMHFAGFEATENLLQDQQNKNDNNNRQKSKNEVYKQIIEKSKAYKMLRQQQYEQNFNMANELDDGFDKLVGQLKFRNKDQQLLQKLQHRDLEYDKLMNQLRDDERIVSNKIVEKNQKLTEKLRKRKNDQLNKLMRDSSGEEDIRGWVDGEESGEEEGDINDSEGSNDQQEQNDEGSNNEDVDGQQQQQEGSYDELDDVQLSSQQHDQQAQQGEQQVQDSNQQEEQEGEGDVVGDESADQQDQQVDGQQNDDQDESNDQDQDDEEEQQESDSYQEPVFTQKNNKKHQLQQQAAAKRNVPTSQQSKQNPQKKRKLNFIE